MERIKAACRTNEPQISSCIMLTLLNVSVVFSVKHPVWWGWILAITMYPMLAFVSNIINPIPHK